MKKRKVKVCRKSNFLMCIITIITHHNKQARGCQICLGTNYQNGKIFFFPINNSIDPLILPAQISMVQILPSLPWANFCSLCNYFLLADFYNYTSSTNFLFPRIKWRIHFDKNGLGYLLGEFFANLSGHPDPSHGNAKSNFLRLKRLLKKESKILFEYSVRRWFCQTGN
jgi:hypothetical protein